LIHVLTGPDHISAIITLSVGGSYAAFWLGVRWGMGHSLGLLIMFVVFLTFGDSAIVRESGLGFFADLMVGIFMLGLGALGAYRALEPQAVPTPHQAHLRAQCENAECASNAAATGDNRSFAEFAAMSEVGRRGRCRLRCPPVRWIRTMTTTRTAR
jgi:hypothetical protein